MKGLLSLVILLAVAAVVWWSITTDIAEDAIPDQAAEGDFIQAFMNEFEITRMDETGAPLYKLRGEYLEKRQGSDETHVRAPDLQLLHNNRWHVSARTAVINDKQETMRLEQDVIMRQIGVEPAIVLNTDSMLINTRTEIASTADPVKVIQGGSELNGTGMVYNNLTGEMELSSDVSGFYQPANR